MTRKTVAILGCVVAALGFFYIWLEGIVARVSGHYLVPDAYICHAELGAMVVIIVALMAAIISVRNEPHLLKIRPS